MTIAPVCPLTGEAFEDPVIDPEGNTYERVAIEEWIRREGTSPITRSPLSADQLVPNRAIRDQIESASSIGERRTSNSVEGAGGDLSHAAATPARSCIKIQPPGLAIRIVPDDTLETREEANENPRSIVSVEIAPAPSPSKDDNSPAMATKRNPAHLILVIDVSGSMGAAASVKSGGDSANEDVGLSVLDITKHAAKTAILLLEPGDFLSLISFHDVATVHLRAVPMTPDDRTKALAAVDALEPRTSTNLWDGLRKGLEVSSTTATDAGPGVLSSLFLLTDGVPNVGPPRGHLPTLRRFLDQNPVARRCTVDTFGFGYSLDSELLLGLAVEGGGGGYSFIPDASFVGTVFVHAVSNALSRCVGGATLSVELPSSSVAAARGEMEAVVLGAGKVDSARRQLKTTWSDWGVAIDVGALSFDQVRNVVISLPASTIGIADRIAPELSATLTYYDHVCESTSTVTASVSTKDPSCSDHIRRQILRCKAVDAIMDLMGASDTFDQARPIIEGFVKLMNTHGKCMDDDGGLLSDVSGQVTEAVSKREYFSRWGKHYLPALARAHLMQVCTNFKDPGLQHYGGSLFEVLRDRADDLFTALPPPKPSRRCFRTGGSGAGGPATVSSATFGRRYYNSSNPCFHGDCLTALADGSSKRVKDVKKGDVVVTGDGTAAKIACVVRTLVDGGRCDMVHLKGGLVVTPYHPIRIDGSASWAFPKDLGRSIDTPCPEVYSFVLEDGRRSLMIDGIECIALGHGILNDPVSSHPYFGTERVVDDLRRFEDDWGRGLVTFEHGPMERIVPNDVNSLVAGVCEERCIRDVGAVGARVH